jgi:hypothetical protein
MDIFPIEIIRDILGYLRPTIQPTVADETAIRVENHQYNNQYNTTDNWWSKNSASLSENQQELARLRRNRPLDSFPFSISKKRDRRYAAILPLRL